MRSLERLIFGLWHNCCWNRLLEVGRLRDSLYMIAKPRVLETKEEITKKYEIYENYEEFTIQEGFITNSYRKVC